MPRDIVFAALVPWGRMPYWRWRALFRAGLARGHRVLWVDSFSPYGAMREALRRPASALTHALGRGRLDQPDPGLWHLRSPLRVGARGRLHRAAAAQVRAAMTRLGFEAPALWVASPAAWRMIGTLGASLSLYDCSDDLERAGAPAWLVADEARVLERADAVWTCSPALAEARRGARGPVFSVPNGVDVDVFAGAARPGPIASELRGLARPLIGYHGTLYARIDWELVGAVCRREPGWTFAFCGAVEEPPPPAVRTLPNLRLLPARPYLDVARFYRGCDACWIPHRASALAASQSSLKLFEYLAAGRPAVVTPMHVEPGLERVVRVAEPSAEAVDRALREELASSGPERVRARQAAVAEHSWARRFDAIEGALAEAAA